MKIIKVYENRYFDGEGDFGDARYFFHKEDVAPPFNSLDTVVDFLWYLSSYVCEHGAILLDDGTCYLLASPDPINTTIPCNPITSK